jgi:hypothetical protein
MLNFLLSALGSENGDSMISFMKDITKPVFKIALIGYDLINDPGVFWEAIKDLFSFSPFTPLQSTLAIDLEPSQYNLRTAEWVRSIWTIVASIAQTLYGNLIAGKDLQGEIPPGQEGDDIQKENTKTERTIRDGAAINLIVWLVDILAFSPVHRQELKSSTFAEKTKFKLIDYLYPFASNAILLLSANEELDDGNSESDSLTAQSFISDIIHKLLGAVYAWIIFEEKGSDRKTSDLLEGIASTLDIFLAIGNEVFAYGFDFDPKGQKVWGVFQLAMEVLKGWKEISAVFGD